MIIKKVPVIIYMIAFIIYHLLLTREREEIMEMILI